MIDRSKIAKKSRRKGQGFERKVCQLLEELTGYKFRRTPGSGSWCKEKLTGDVACIDNDNFEWSIECFTGDTLVMTKKGYVSIKDIRVGDKVLTHKMRFKKVTNCFKSHKQVGSMKLRSQTEKIHVTNNHPFEDFYGNWVEASKAKSTSHICLSSNDNDIIRKKLKVWNGINEYILPDPKIVGNKIECLCGCGKFIDKLDKKKRVKRYILGHSGTIPNNINIPLNVSIDNDLLYMFGLYIAEGHTSNSNYKVVWTFNIKEEQYVRSLERIIIDKFKIRPTIKQHKEENTTTVIINSIIISRFFSRLFGSNSRGKRLNEFIFHNKTLLSSLIKGCFDGDGCYGNDFVRYETVSRTLAFDIQFALLRYSIFSSVTKSKRNNLYSVQISRSCIDRFYSMLTKKINVELCDININSLHNIVFNLPKHRITTPIQSFERNTSIEYVYNLEVEEDNSFVIESGVVVHNCKNQEGWDLSQLLRPESDKGKTKILHWWDQCLSDARKLNKKPMLLFTKNHYPVYCMCFTDEILNMFDYCILPEYYFDYGHRVIFIFEDFIEVNRRMG